MVLGYDSYYVLGCTVIYAILCKAAWWLILAFDGGSELSFQESPDKNKKAKRPGWTFMYAPGVALALLVPLVLLVLADKSIVLTGLWLWIWYIAVSCLVIAVIAGALSLLVILAPLGVVLLYLFGKPVAIFIMGSVLFIWGAISLLACINKLRRTDGLYDKIIHLEVG